MQARIREIFRELGPKFTHPRPIQATLLPEIYSSLSKLNMLEAPTGIGKSPMALCLGEMMDSSLTVVNTATISLQNQYERDFPDICKLVGRNNFPCLKAPVSAAEAPCIADPSIFCESGYHAQEIRARRARTIVTNYALYLSDLMYGRRWHERRPGLLVCDEGHRLLDFLSSAETVRLDTKLANKVGLSCSPLDTLAAAKGWVEKYGQRIHDRAYVLMASGSPWSRDWVTLMRQAEGIASAPSNLVATRTGEIFEATPVWPKAAARMLLASADHILVMSATLWGGQFFADLLGFDQEYQYHSAPSPFDSWRWPVYYHPVAALNKKVGAAAWNKISEACHGYMHDRPGDRGIIHVASNLQCELAGREILRCDACRGRLVLLRRGGKRSESIERYRANPAAWIIHPSLGEGESFDDEQCRIQLIAKIKFPDLGDPLVSMRASSSTLGQKYYFGSTAAYTAQTVGRGMRSTDDFCETFILDGSFATLYDRNRSAFPSWFHRQLR